MAEIGIIPYKNQKREEKFQFLPYFFEFSKSFLGLNLRLEKNPCAGGLYQILRRAVCVCVWKFPCVWRSDSALTVVVQFSPPPVVWGVQLFPSGGDAAKGVVSNFHPSNHWYQYFQLFEIFVQTIILKH